MLIDSSIVVMNPVEGDFKARKKGELGQIKPVENAGKGKEAELKNDRDKITEKKPDTRRFDTGALYNKYGEPDRDENDEVKQKPVNVVV